ncbi:hypothetical protein [Mesorhizobium japonicum]|nr:hypothetical protein [Mesorhizobium japonicum]
MRITVLQQMARGLPAPFDAAAPAAVAVLESVRRHLWHAYVDGALALLEDFGDGFDLISDPPHEVRKLRRYLEEFSRYVAMSTTMPISCPNAERHRYGEVVSTAFVESTVNRVIGIGRR